MVNIVVLGWYGTETIGDRAILAGIFKIFSSCFDRFAIKLGSLYTFFSERTVMEDMDFYNKISDGKMESLTIFPYLEVSELKKNIINSDFVIFGGGPIMDISYIYAIEYGFKYAKKNNKKTGIIGCGVGPIFKQEYFKCLHRLLNMSDIAIFRDKESLAFIEKDNCRCQIHCSIDPAVFAANFFLLNSPKKQEEMKYIAFNFRDIDVVNNDCKESIYTTFFVNIIKHELEKSEYNVRLVPMHTFVVGGDDRYYLSKIERLVNNPRVKVLQEPLSLELTMAEYHNAEYCYGMRFHSVLLQTITNGHNSVLDYTNEKNGKTVGLLRNFGLYESLKNNNRYISLHTDKLEYKAWETYKKNIITNDQIDCYYNVYVECIKSLEL